MASSVLPARHNCIPSKKTCECPGQWSISESRGLTILCDRLWEPYALFTALQTHYDNSSGSRAAIAFASLAFVLAQFGIAVAENALSNGIDLSALCPRYFNIVRGGLLTAAVAFIMQPWQLLNGASKFLTVIGGYAVFLGPFTGVMFADYFIIRKRLLKLTSLYDFSDASIYWYNKGINWRAPVAWISGVWLLLPGFAEYVRHGTSVELAGWSKMYFLAVSHSSRGSYPFSLQAAWY